MRHIARFLISISKTYNHTNEFVILSTLTLVNAKEQFSCTDSFCQCHLQTFLCITTEFATKPMLCIFNRMHLFFFLFLFNGGSKYQCYCFHSSLILAEFFSSCMQPAATVSMGDGNNFKMSQILFFFFLLFDISVLLSVPLQRLIQIAIFIQYPKFLCTQYMCYFINIYKNIRVNKCIIFQDKQ